MSREKLAELRIEKKLTRKELAEELDVAEVTVRKIEEGSRNPSVNMAKKFAIFYQKELSDLFPEIFLINYDTKRSKTTS